MDKDVSVFPAQTATRQTVATEIHKGARDLIVLRYMARQVLTMSQRPDELATPATMKQPLLYLLQERHNRSHRIALYQAKESFLLPNLLFVGFISKKQAALDAQIGGDIANVDKKMLNELVEIPGLLSYSSLQFRNGNWCNLVLFREETAKTHIRSSSTHSYAAYHLAPRYYDWIRLHNGRVDGGLVQGRLMLNKTHLYTFPIPHGRPSIQELTYAHKKRV